MIRDLSRVEHRGRHEHNKCAANNDHEYAHANDKVGDPEAHHGQIQAGPELNSAEGRLAVGVIAIQLGVRLAACDFKVMHLYHV